MMSKTGAAICRAGLVVSALALGAMPALAQVAPGTTNDDGTGAPVGARASTAITRTAGKMGPGTTGLSSNGAGMHRTGMGLEPSGVSGVGTSGAGVSTTPGSPANQALPSDLGTGAHNPATVRPLATTGGVPR